MTDQLDIPKVATSLSLDSSGLKMESGHESMCSVNPNHNDEMYVEARRDRCCYSSALLAHLPSHFDLPGPSTSTQGLLNRNDSRSLNFIHEHRNNIANRSSEPLYSASSSGIVTMSSGSNSQDLVDDQAQSNSQDSVNEPTPEESNSRNAHEPTPGLTSPRNAHEPTPGPNSSVNARESTPGSNRSQGDEDEPSFESSSSRAHEPTPGPSGSRNVHEPIPGPSGSRNVHEPTPGPSTSRDEEDEPLLEHVEARVEQRPCAEERPETPRAKAQTELKKRDHTRQSLIDEFMDQKKQTTSKIPSFYHKDDNLFDFDSTENVNIDKEFLEWYGKSMTNNVVAIPMHIVPPDVAEDYRRKNCRVLGGFSVFNPIRKIVSQKRRRFIQHGFNMDLTYITDRIIAMGYPADAFELEGLYRNTMKDTQQFLWKFHSDKYWIYNLRGRYSYDPNSFKNRVTSFDMEDHHPPRLEFMAPFCRQTEIWLEQDPRNVIAVHCKAGKGRTGVMICAFLVHINLLPNPRQVLDYYSIIRTMNNQGVTIPSQRRYIYYYDHLRRKKLNYLPLRSQLVGIYLEGLPEKNEDYYIRARAINGDVLVYESAVMKITKEYVEKQKTYTSLEFKHPHHPIHNPGGVASCLCFGWTCPSKVFLEGDIRIDILWADEKEYIKQEQANEQGTNNLLAGTTNLVKKYKKGLKKGKTIGHVWFNTMFSCPGFCKGHFEQSDESRIPLRSTAFQKTNYVRRANKEDPECMLLEKTVSCTYRIQRGTLNNSVFKPPPTVRDKKHLFSIKDMDALNYTFDKELSDIRLTPAAAQALRTTATKVSKLQRKKLGKKVNGLWNSNAQQGRFKKVIHPAYKKLIYHHGKYFLMKKLSSKVIGLQDYFPKDMNVQVRNSLGLLGNDEFNFVEGYLDIPKTRVTISEPPKLEEHCPRVTLPLIYNRRIPPREDIDKILRVAKHNKMVEKFYQKRRLQTQFNPNRQVPRYQNNGRPEGDPFNLYVLEGEHVQSFNRYDIDVAHKSKDPSITDKLKLFVVTKCITQGVVFPEAQKFIKMTRKRQQRIDENANYKRKLAQCKQKIKQCQILTEMTLSETKSSRGEPHLLASIAEHINRMQLFDDLTEDDVGLYSKHEKCVFQNCFVKDMNRQLKQVKKERNQYLAAEKRAKLNIWLHPTLNANIDLDDRWDPPADVRATTKVYSASQMKTEEKKMVTKYNSNPKMDPRFESGYYSKFFYRQRAGSPTKYPNIHHHCPLMTNDVQICRYYDCAYADTEFAIKRDGTFVEVEAECTTEDPKNPTAETELKFTPFVFDHTKTSQTPKADLSKLNPDVMENYFPDNRNPAMLEGEPEPILDDSGQAQGGKGKTEGASGTSKETTVRVEEAPGTSKATAGQAEVGQGTKSLEQADQPCSSAQCVRYDAAAESVELPAVAERAQSRAQAQNASSDEDQPASGSSGSHKSPRPCLRVTPCTYEPALSIQEKETMQPIVDLMKLDRSQVEKETFVRNANAHLTPKNACLRMCSARNDTVEKTERANEELFRSRMGHTPQEPCNRLCQCLCSKPQCSMKCKCHLLYQVHAAKWDDVSDDVCPYPAEVASLVKKYAQC